MRASVDGCNSYFFIKGSMGEFLGKHKQDLGNHPRKTSDLLSSIPPILFLQEEANLKQHLNKGILNDTSRLI